MSIVRWDADHRRQAKAEGKVLACLAIDDRELDLSVLGKSVFYLSVDRKTARKNLGVRNPRYQTRTSQRSHAMPDAKNLVNDAELDRLRALRCNAEGAAEFSLTLSLDLVDRLVATVRRLQGAMEAQDRREQAAGEKCGVPWIESGCDHPDAMAEEILRLRLERDELFDAFRKMIIVSLPPHDISGTRMFVEARQVFETIASRKAEREP